MTQETNRAEPGHNFVSIRSSLLEHVFKRIPIGILFFVWFAIVITNVVPGTWFTGWDNLHPELNIALNLKRALFGVWQEHQGLGHIGGHGFAATLPHTIITWLLSFTFPVNQVRITIIFIALLTGALGCYALLIHLLKENASKLTHWLALIGSLFYLLNYGTVQQFYTPLEAFVVHFAALPWLLFLVFRLLDCWTKRDFFLFLLVNLAATTQGFIPPLFLAYGLTLGLVLSFALLFHRRWDTVKRVALIVFATMCINAYWILPVGHFTATAQNTYLNANNNILSTRSWIETNQTYGTFKNLAILRGFLSQAVDDVEGTQSPIFATWEDHIKLVPIQSVGYILFGIILVGLTGYALAKRKKPELALAIVGMLTFSLLATDVPGLSVFSHMLDKFPLVRQAFRAGFTKLSILLALDYSIFLAFGVYTIVSLITKINKPSLVKTLQWCILLSIGANIILFSLPAFRGHFLYQRAHLAIPTAYQDVFTFFKKQDPAGRVALLPQGDHWGWDVYRWGYSGSGFLWFGLQQPIMERAFDVWSSNNENYYWELSYALYSHNPALLSQVLAKYKIHWVVFDTSIIPFPHPHAGFATDDIGKLISETQLLDLVAELPINNQQKDHISIYRVNQQRVDQSFVTLAQSLAQDDSSTEWGNNDRMFELFGPYQKGTGPSDPTSPAVFFPFRSLFSGRPFTQEPFETFLDREQITLSTHIPTSFSHGLLNLRLPPEVKKAKKSSVPSLILDGEILDIPTATSSPTLTLPTIFTGVFSASFGLTASSMAYDSGGPNSIVTEIKRCDANQEKGTSKSTKRTESGMTVYQVVNRASSSCMDLFLSSIPQQGSYIMSITSKHITGSPLTLQLINGTSQRTDLTRILPETREWQTSTFIIPPMQPDGAGYSIRLANAAITNNPSVNEIGTIQLIAFPWYGFFTSLYLEKGYIQRASFSTDGFSVDHPNPAYYKIRLQTSDFRRQTDNTLILSQAFNSGWSAWERIPTFPYVRQLKNHVLVNNWANGWRLGQETTIILFFLPQLLEWIGFALLPLPFVWLLIRKEQYAILDQ